MDADECRHLANHYLAIAQQRSVPEDKAQMMGIAAYWTDRALTWSHEARDPALSVRVLARKSQLASDMHDADEAIGTADAALQMAEPRSRLAAVASTYLAHGHALAGDYTESERRYGRAYDLVEGIDPDPASAWGAWLDPAYVTAHRALSLLGLERYSEAAEAFGTAIAALPAGYRRDRGVYTARQARAVAGADDPEQAASLGLRALGSGARPGQAESSRSCTSWSVGWFGGRATPASASSARQ